MNEEQLKQNSLTELEKAVRDGKSVEEIGKLEQTCFTFRAQASEILDAIYKGKGWK